MRSLFLFGLMGVALSAVAAGPNDLLPKNGVTGVLPTGADGKPLNTDFETGDLRDWKAAGDAFTKQPVEGDLVHPRRKDSYSRHQGKFWIGGYEIVQDKGQGTLTSAPFRVTQPWAAFRCAGGAYDNCRVELVRTDNNEVFFRTTVFEPEVFEATGNCREDLRPCVVDLAERMGQEIYIRLVDQQVGHWGHLNFDDFRLYAKRPEFDNEFKPVKSGLKKLGGTPAQPAAPTDQYKYAGLAPEAAAQAMTLPPGFKATLFAGEPDVKQPIAMALDDRGRLWVAEAYSYPIKVPEKNAKDRILIFEDTNHDGKFDKVKVFKDNLNLVSGLEIGFGGVWVGAAPQLLFIPDRDGDDVPDGEPEVVLDGWGYQDSHETLNSFIWGPDGWLYGCHGVFTHSRVGAPGTPDDKRVPINAGIWRYHPTKRTFEVFAHGTSNPWGFDFNDRGQSFLTACVIPHLWHVIQGGRYQRQAGPHFNPYTYDDIKTIAKHRHYVGGNPHGGNGRSDSAGGGHAHAGAMIYLGGSWPEKYRDQIFMNNIHGARINQDALQAEGSGYSGDRAPDFLLANDIWSQIIYLTYGPDGGVYMIDWYDKNQCHHHDVNAHDRANGRVFKITYSGADAPQQTPTTLADFQGDLKKATNDQLVALQLHTNDWYVRHARRILQERAAAKPHVLDGTPALTALEKLSLDHADDTRQLRGMWALHAVGADDYSRTFKALKSSSPYVRGWAVQLVCEEGKICASCQKWLEDLAAQDPSPIVRKYLASAAQRLPLAGRVALIKALTAHSEDAADHNLPLLYWYAAESLVPDRIDDALAVLAGAKIPLVRDFLIRRLAQTGEPAILDKLLTQALPATKPAAEQRGVLRGVNEGLKGRRTVAMPDAWKAIYPQLAQSADAGVRSEALALAMTFGDPLAVAAQRKLLADGATPMAARLEALQALVKINAAGLAPTLQGLIRDPQLGPPAIRALAAYDDAGTPTILLAALDALGAEAKRDALSTLCARPTFAEALLNAVETKKLPATALTADLITQMRNLKRPALDDRITKVWGAVRDTPEDKKKEIERLKKLLAANPKAENKPEVTLGRAVFTNTCQNCHMLFAVGQNIGPDLTGSNRANLDYVLSNIVDPSALVGKDYQSHVISLNSGRVLTGIIKAEDNQSLTLATATETVVVPKNEIDEHVLSEKSLMPDGQHTQMTERELRSLVAYLASPSQTPLAATPATAKLFFNGKDLTGWTGDPKLWSVEHGEIVGRATGLKHNEFLKSDLVLADFRLSVEVKLEKNAGNSGVQFRSSILPNGHMKGYQADIGKGWWGKLYEEEGRGLLWDKSGEEHLKVGEWNRYEIEARGDRIRTWLNRQRCVDLTDPPGARSGQTGFQLHSGEATEIRIRNIELELLSNK